MYYILLPIGWLVWHLAFRIRVIGRENLIRDRGFILAPNHVSAIDPVFVVISRFWGKKMRIFAKQELFAVNPFVTWFIRMVGAVAVRGTKEERAAVDKTIEECKSGRGLLIFPEGTRTHDGSLGQIKSGAFVVASAAQVDMIPCRLIYDTKDGRAHPFCRTRVCFGKPIPAEELAMGEKRDIKKLKAAKQRLADAWQALYEQNRFAGKETAE
jgi:1-acyl-sn-glycerol-3-phosphate acyltransferase